MILIVHQKASHVLEVIKDGKPLDIKFNSCVEAFWNLSEKFENEIIAWCDVALKSHIDLSTWDNVFHHDLIMASYGVNTMYLPQSIGYIDQLPFANILSELTYATWRMSSDVGGMKGEVILKFKDLFDSINNFEYLINSIAKIGQQNGLFCYSAPDLIKLGKRSSLEYTATKNELFSFVFQHYKSFRVVVLFWCIFKYDKEVPLFFFIASFFRSKFFKKRIDLSDIFINSKRIFTNSNTLDVIIPTIGRTQHLLQVLDDLKNQTLLPKRVIIIEQNQDPITQSELTEGLNREFPFEIIHKFIHQTGACNARNIALKEIKAEWVFFCDDDNRIDNDLLRRGLEEIRKYGVEVLNTAYIQTGESRIYEDVKQWGTFGAGNGIALTSAVKDINFSMVFEHSYGEDVDFGMQLRLIGNEIMYHPNLEIIHLKAPMGGFRTKPKLPWISEEYAPKPSPALLALALKYFSKQQLLGFKTVLFLKFYASQTIKNPLKYYNNMQKRWETSNRWANHLIKENE
ncbi:glycosyltransferase family 2 protein [Gillisia marina]|uniref:glycosyltransferase family 2 protein n=1 Tax=Gillisia marina TaxID=1167637 RepID=UPI000299DBB6|nr:glycosyltransferase family 2 protein [Gillisia marina]